MRAQITTPTSHCVQIICMAMANRTSAATPSTSSYSVRMFRPTISGTNVTVQALSSSGVVSRLVSITPLESTRLTATRMIQKVLLKCTSKDGKESKTFAIRNIYPNPVRL